jgi:hypothetical protein
MIKQKVLIQNNEIIRIGNDYEIDQHDYLNQSFIRINLPQELYGEEQRFLAFVDGQIVLQAELKQSTLRVEKLQNIRSIRDQKLMQADHAIFKAEDNNQDASALRAHRTQLRDFTEQFKDENGNPSPILDDIIVDEIQFPEKPTE